MKVHVQQSRMPGLAHCGEQITQFVSRVRESQAAVATCETCKNRIAYEALKQAEFKEYMDRRRKADEDERERYAKDLIEQSAKWLASIRARESK